MKYQLKIDVLRPSKRKQFPLGTFLRTTDGEYRYVRALEALPTDTYVNGPEHIFFPKLKEVGDILELDREMIDLLYSVKITKKKSESLGITTFYVPKGAYFWLEVEI